MGMKEFLALAFLGVSLWSLGWAIGQQKEPIIHYSTIKTYPTDGGGFIYIYPYNRNYLEPHSHWYM